MVGAVARPLARKVLTSERYQQGAAKTRTAAEENKVRVAAKKRGRERKCRLFRGAAASATTEAQD